MLTTTFWTRIALINLCLVAVLGSLMRYKLAFAFPHFDQKFLQEAHSHFAFAGWITHTIYFLLVILFRNNLGIIHEKRYRNLILINLFSAYSMLISFTIQGYGLFSIIFSSITILNGYVFSYFALKDASRLPNSHPGKNWIRAAIWFGVLSTMGTVILSYMVSTRHLELNIYLGSVFFFLHFQYNGLFLFACMGIFLDKIKFIIEDKKQLQYSFWLFFLSGIPAYFLSILWAHLSFWLYSLVVLAAIMQFIGWFLMIRVLRPNLEKIKSLFKAPAFVLFIIIALALTLKLLLQLGSTIPDISKLAFGFRPIVIAYLHLVLLLIVSVFLLSYMHGTGLLSPNKKSGRPLLFFVSAVILNEVVLATQGIAAFSYTVIPYVNEALFGIAVLLFTSAFFLAKAQFSTSAP